MKHLTIVILSFTFISLLGCTPPKPNMDGFEHNTFACNVIIESPKATKHFLEFEGIVYDEIWIPNQDDICELRSSLRKYLGEAPQVTTETWVNRDFLLSNISKYKMEYSGFIRKGVRYIICNMILYSGGEKGAAKEQFTIILDGGCGVVRVIFKASDKSVVRIDCNGVA